MDTFPEARPETQLEVDRCRLATAGGGQVSYSRIRIQSSRNFLFFFGKMHNTTFIHQFSPHGLRIVKFCTASYFGLLFCSPVFADPLFLRNPIKN